MCSQIFSSGNKLHQHIHICICNISEALHAAKQLELPLIMSNTPKSHKNELAHQGWHYASLRASATEKGKKFNICVNTECSLDIVTQSFLDQYYSNTEVHKAEQSVKIHRIDSKIYKSTGFVTINLYLWGCLGTTEAQARITWEFHVISDLRANVLLEINTLVPKTIIINFISKKLRIESCHNLKVPIQVSTYNATARTIRQLKNNKSDNL